MCSIVARNGLVGLSPSKPARASRRIASTPSRAGAHAGTRAGSPSCCRPAASPRPEARRATAAHRSASSGCPEQREDQRAVHGDRRVALEHVPRARTSSSSAGPCRRVRWPRPAARASSTSRATRSASPAAWACSIAASGRPFASNQAAARECSCRDQAGFAAAELGPQQVPEQMVVAVPLPAPVERDHQQVPALQLLEGGPTRSLSRVASQSGPEMRSSTDVRVRNDRSAGEVRSSSSDRR